MKKLVLVKLAKHRKTDTVRSLLYMESKLVKYTEAESRRVVARDQGKGKWGGDGEEYEVSVLSEKF